MAAVTAFDAALTRRLRRKGLAGRPARVAFEGGALTLSGAESGRVVIPLADVARLRVGSEDTKYGRHYVCCLWLVGSERPLVLLPLGRRPPEYGATVRGFAAELARSGGLERIEGGVSRAAALFMPVAFGLLLLAALGVSLFALGNEPWWGRLIVPLIPGLLFGLGLWLCVTRYWPRPIRSLADLDRHLA
jgi:hypothetical protein